MLFTAFGSSGTGASISRPRHCRCRFYLRNLPYDDGTAGVGRTLVLIILIVSAVAAVRSLCGAGLLEEWPKAWESESGRKTECLVRQDEALHDINLNVRPITRRH